MSKSKTPALRRFEADMHRLLTTLMQREVDDPMLLAMSITRFELMDAQGHAIAYVHSMLTEDKDEAVKRLNSLRSHFLHLLRKAIPKKRLPELEFRWDDALDKTHRVLDTIKELKTS